MLESAQQTKKIDLNYYVINHQWFRVTYVILYKKLADHAYKGTFKGIQSIFASIYWDF